MFEDILETHYKHEEIKSMRELREIFPEGANTPNIWIFLSTGGFHGTLLTLDDIELIVRDEHALTESVDDKYWVTVLVIQPDVSVMRYGEIMIDESDLPYLRNLVRGTIDKVVASQNGNI